MTREKLPIEGMHCTNCSASIERAFARLEGIEVHVLLAENAGIFVYDERWNRAKIARELRKLGFRLRQGHSAWEMARLWIGIACTLPLMVCMVLMMLDVAMPHWMHWAQFGLATVVVLVLGGRFVLGSVRDLRQRILGMDVLITLGTGLAYVYSVVLLAMGGHQLYFDTAAMLLTIISVGKAIEGKVKVKSTAALQALMALQVDTATLLEGDTTRTASVDEVQAGQIILAAQGQNIALDGEVVDGIAEVDEAMLTGESIPVTKQTGDGVMAGTLVTQGNLTVRVTAPRADSYLQSIIARVDRIQQEKPHIQRIADRIATIFVPAVVLVALVCFAVSYWALGMALPDALQRAIAVLVISCPCSLGLAAPLSIVIGTTRAGKMGILYQNSEIFEKLRRIDAVCFDKTGTLSTGKLRVVAANATPQFDSIGYTLEHISAHPIAVAMCDYWRDKGVTLDPTMHPVEEIGRGVRCEDWFIAKQGSTVTLYRGRQSVATWQVADTLKEDAVATVTALVDAGIEVYMITGDDSIVAQSVAETLGLAPDHVFAKVRPEDKSDILHSLQQQGKRVAFVGDGINDSPALSQADFAIAMAEGTDVAKSVADMTVCGNLMRVYHGIRLSRLVYRNIIENYCWAFSYNLVAIPLAFAGILSPLVAGCCMAFSNITVVCNALRLFLAKLNK